MGIFGKSRCTDEKYQDYLQRKVVVATRSQCPIGFLCIMLFFIFLLLLLNINYTRRVLLCLFTWENIK